MKLGARAITALAALKLTPLFALAAIGMFFVDWGQVSFSLAAVPSWGAFGASMVLVMFAYSGMETALVPSGEVRDPARNVPRATLVAIAAGGAAVPGAADRRPGRARSRALGTSGVPVADTAGALWSPGRVLLLVTACISMTGFLMGNLLGTSRLVFALGRDGYLPRAFGTVSANHRVPLLALAGARGAGGGAGDRRQLRHPGAGFRRGDLPGLRPGRVAAWRAQRRDLRERGEPFVLPGGPLVPAFAVAAMVAIVDHAERQGMARRSAWRWRCWWWCTRCWLAASAAPRLSRARRPVRRIGGLRRRCASSRWAGAEDSALPSRDSRAALAAAAPCAAGRARTRW